MDQLFSKDNNKDTDARGRVGEEVAIRYLTKKGFRILDRNFQTKFLRGPRLGEIDIVAQKADTISFVEVKTIFTHSIQRESPWLPEEKVNFQKRQKIGKAAQVWLMNHRMSLETKIQVDVIAIFVDPQEKKAKVRYFPNIMEF